MSFGFSIGDVITCSQLAVQTYKALQGAPKEFESLRLEFRSLNSTLKGLADELESPTSLIHSANRRRQEDISVLLQDAKTSMESLQRLVLKYSGLQSDAKRERFLKKIAFASENQQGVRDKLAIHTASINLFLATLTSGSLGRLEFMFKNSSSQSSFLEPQMNIQSVTLGSRDLNVAPSKESTSGKPWISMWDDLAVEGFTDDHIEKHGEHVKAYLRYLAHGSTPFWSDNSRARKAASAGRVGVAAMAGVVSPHSTNRAPKKRMPIKSVISGPEASRLEEQGRYEYNRRELARHRSRSRSRSGSREYRDRAFLREQERYKEALSREEFQRKDHVKETMTKSERVIEIQVLKTQSAVGRAKSAQMMQRIKEESDPNLLAALRRERFDVDVEVDRAYRRIVALETEIQAQKMQDLAHPPETWTRKVEQQFQLEDKVEAEAEFEDEDEDEVNELVDEFKSLFDVDEVPLLENLEPIRVQSPPSQSLRPGKDNRAQRDTPGSSGKIDTYIDDRRQKLENLNPERMRAIA